MRQELKTYNRKGYRNVVYLETDLFKAFENNRKKS